jgi:hypothetical protein
MSDRVTSSFATLPVSPAAYDEIRAALEKAGYQFCFIQSRHGEVISMSGIGLVRKAEVCAGCLGKGEVCCCGRPLDGSHDHTTCGPPIPCDLCTEENIEQFDPNV